MYPATFPTITTLSLPTFPLPLRLVLQHHFLLPSSSHTDTPEIDPTTTSLSELLRVIDIYRDEGKPLKVGVEMLLGGRSLGCGEVGGVAERVRGWFEENEASLGLNFVSELSTSLEDGSTSFLLHPSRSSIAPSNPSRRPSGRLVALDIKLHWGRKVVATSKKGGKKKKKRQAKEDEPSSSSAALKEEPREDEDVEMEVAMVKKEEDEEGEGAKKADSLEEYIALNGKSLAGPNMSTGAVDVLDKAMLQVEKFHLGRNYPFIFHNARLEKVELQLPYLQSIVGSLSDIIHRSGKSVRKHAKESFLEIQSSNQTLIQSTRSALRKLAQRPSSGGMNGDDDNEEEDEEAGKEPFSDEEDEDGEELDAEEMFERALTEGITRVYLNEIKAGWMKISQPPLPDHPLPLPLPPLPLLHHQPILSPSTSPEPQAHALPLLLLDDFSDAEMLSDQPDDASLAGANSPSLPLITVPANYPLPLPDSDEELDASADRSPLVDVGGGGEEVLQGGYLWESDDDDDEGVAASRSLSGRTGMSARLIEIDARIESRVGSMVSERRNGGEGLMMRRGSSSAHRVQEEEEGSELVVVGGKMLAEAEGDDEEEEEGWW